MKSSRFIVTLLLLVVAITLMKWFTQSVEQTRLIIFVRQLLNCIYLFTPALAVMVTEKWKIRHVLVKYHLTLRNINTKALVKYIFLTAIILPAFVLIFIYLFGNVLGFANFGTLETQPIDNYTFNGILLSSNVLFRILTLSLFIIATALLAGLTYNMLFALGGEIAWRGYLEENVHLPYFQKYLLIGLIWGIWTLPIILLSGKGIWDCLYSGLSSILFCIIASFYMANALKEAKTLFAPAASMGIISSFMLTWLINASNTPNSFLIGSKGLLFTLSIFIINIAFAKKYRDRTH